MYDLLCCLIARWLALFAYNGERKSRSFLMRSKWAGNAEQKNKNGEKNGNVSERILCLEMNAQQSDANSLMGNQINSLFPRKKFSSVL